MHAFQPESFAILSPAKAKAAALALFDSAMLEPAADWRGVAYALHSVVSRKRGPGAAVALDEIAMGDAADAAEYVAWADYAATGKAANIARGRVTVTFADGWSKTVGMLAGKTGKGRKPWSIAHAVRFAVICYKIAAVRRATGSDAAIYFDMGGNASGQSITLDALICAPEIVSVISADSSETDAGDLVWNPEEANAFTRDQRAGAVAVSNAYEPHTLDASRAIYAARGALLARMGLVYVASYALAKAAAERVASLLWPAEIVSRSCYDFDCFGGVIEAEPAAYPWDAAMVRDFTDSPGLAQMAGFTPDVTDAPEPVDASPVEVVETADPVDASPDDAPAPSPHASYSDSLPVISIDPQTGRWCAWLDGRSQDITDVWPGAVVLIATSHRSRAKLPPGIAKVSHMPYPQAGVLADAETAKSYLDVKGIRITGPRRSVKALRFPADEPQDVAATVAAPIVAVEPPKPARKPRYRYSHVSGTWEIIPHADDATPLAA